MFLKNKSIFSLQKISIYFRKYFIDLKLKLIFFTAWLFFPCFGSLSSLMKKYRTQFKKARSDTRISDRELLGDLYDVYYNSRDLKLLLDLLAASSGIAPCLRILCLFDKNMRKMVEVSNLIFQYFSGKKLIIFTKKIQ